jgi:hypothetical protein
MKSATPYDAARASDEQILRIERITAKLGLESAALTAQKGEQQSDWPGRAEKLVSDAMNHLSELSRLTYRG